MQDSTQEASEKLGTGSENERREKLFRLKNRLARQPGDLGVIEEYVGLMLNSTSQEDGAEKLETYDRLEGFLLSRAEDVEPEEVDALLDMADKLDERRERVLRQSEPDVQVSEADQRVVDAYEEWREDGIDTTVPKDPEEAEQKLSLSEAVQALIRDQDREPLDGLDNLIERLEVATQADRSLRRAKQIIESAREESDSSQAAYILQSAEQAIQQLVMSREDLGAARREKVDKIVHELEGASDEITKARRYEEDLRRWESFLEEYEDVIASARSSSPNGGIQRQFLGKESVVETEEGGQKVVSNKTELEPDENIRTQKIEKYEKVIQVMGRVLEKVYTEEITKNVKEKEVKLKRELEDVHQKREKIYNKFALARIRKCFSKAEEVTGTTWSDRSEIANQLVKYLAEVDQRFLTTEVSRCYSEVFDHLYDKLKSAKSDDDFEEEGRKLNVLKRMHETESIGIEAF